MDKKTYLIFGVSKGLGKAITQQLPDTADTIFGISRSEPDYLDTQKNMKWISMDLSNPSISAQILKEQLENQKLDYFIYNVGIWEEQAFSTDYDFEHVSESEIVSIINTNITSCLLTIQSVIANLKQANNAKVILIGSTWGLDNHNSKEVAFSATKFALRGMIHALRENLRPYKIGVSILNLGYLATVEDEQNNEELIPLADVINALRFITQTSNASCVKEINMPAMQDLNI
ncbi:SDR family NAD(P)-dependent oxidoreductase [Sphingobacterium luzhongxinii]|uniref:SDR family NAD(P)-dependent oxidoreductase n=1 Tax=Sphingobacterium luzhongxinii TaxID=2654181 RepID=UPI0013D93B06|nr:SDR family NAD(P)-dependent oxidoreductase [Sphingobacterium sp. xlx-73]